MGLRQGQRPVVDIKPTILQPGVSFEIEEAAVQLPVLQRLLHREAGHRRQLELDRRIARSEIIERFRDDPSPTGGCLKSNAQSPDLAACAPFQPIFRLGDHPHDPARILKERVAGIGGAHRPALAEKQGRLEFFLKIPDRVRDRGLHDADAGRGAGEAPVLGDGDEVAKGSNVHYDKNR